MKELSGLIISKHASIKEAMKVISEGDYQVALVVENEALIGILTDGDIRSAILAGSNLDQSILNIFNKEPKFARVGTTKNEMLKIMKDHSIRHLPVVDNLNRLVEVITINDYLNVIQKKNKIVLMAGGLGTRLHPFTKDCPKPLLRVGGKPILEWIIESFQFQGFVDFIVSVNYKAQMIKDYFGDGSKWGVKITYLEESKKLGTAGSLGLLSEIRDPFFVMNGDILTHLDFNAALNNHISENYFASICTQAYSYKIPYGVVVKKESLVTQITEKPTIEHQVNAGIYILNPEVLKGIKTNEYCDMPHLLQEQIDNKERIGTFEISNFITDIGHKEEFLRANECLSSLYQKV